MSKLLISIVPHNCGEFITDTAKKAGAGGGTIAMGRGTATNGILQLLGLGDSSKDIVYIILDNDKYTSVKDELIKASENKKNFGVLFSLEVGDFVKAGSNKSVEKTRGDSMAEKEKTGTYQMINVIVNKG